MTDRTDSSSNDTAGDDLGRRLMDSLLVPDFDLDERIESALSVDYWTSLVPGLAVDGPPAADLSLVGALDPHARREVMRRFETERYLRLPQLLPHSLTTRLHDGVEAVLNADWPAVFAWMFDDFWRVPRATTLVDLISSILGEGYRQTPYVWTNMVSGQRGAGGWLPHMDNPEPPDRVTMWIPLSDATLDTGCISLIPPSAIPASLQAEWHDRQSFDVREMKHLLQASRSIASTPGDVLAWDARVIHWGAARQASGRPRISLSMEFITARSDAPVLQQSLSMVPDSALPSHTERLRLIADAIVLFNRRELRTSKYEGLARRILERLNVV
jgi:ectoine hydroxylase-related dioxygenase (phytanoyl-CoA dioxygenase family)